MKTRYFATLAVVLPFILSACVSTVQAQPVPTETVAPTATATPVPTATLPPTPTPFVGGDCDEGSVRIKSGSYEEYQQASDDYVGSYTLYCLWIPEGETGLTITVSGLVADLDVYVGRDSTITEYENYGGWESVQDETADEEIAIIDPAGGVYYIQVVSYERAATPYTLEISLK